MKFAELKNNLKKQILSCYIIVGNDAYLCNHSLNLIVSSAVNNVPELNITEFSAENLDQESIISACNVMPFMSKKRLVIVKGDIKKGIDKTLLIKYLKNPAETTCLVFFAGESLEVNDIGKFAEVIDCNKLEESLLLKWIEVAVSKSKSIIQKPAAELLIEYCNYDLSRISNETEKLISLVQDREINVSDIEYNVVKDLQYQIYEFTNALIKKNADRTFEIKDSLISKKVAPQILLISAYTQFRRLLHISLSLSANKSIPEIAISLNMKEGAVRWAVADIKKYSQIILKNIVDMCTRADEFVKSGKMSDENA
ncbi:MAG: DNA polymerase III subunit delta, partial [Clostridia bacterium]|nr:DNA polymerase III subunit delta [Clostridia bacterium]